MSASPCSSLHWGLDPLMGQLLGQRGLPDVVEEKIDELDHDNTRRGSLVLE